MRTNDLRVPPSTRLLGYLSAAGVIGFALAACSSSTHLDPPGAAATGAGGGSSAASTTGAGGTGGEEPVMSCRSNPDCSSFPRSVCDLITGTCQECLVDVDCKLKGGPVCLSGKCGCPVKGEAFCGTLGVGQCVDKATSQTDCGDCGHACYGACAAGKCLDPWEPMSLVGAPAARSRHVAVWDSNDKLMIVWGGRTAAGSATTGGVYDPATNTWTATSTANAPVARVDATAVWDDVHKVMIVWGGRASFGGGPALGSGALYDPVKNVWKTIGPDAKTPSARWGHTAVWTGERMIVWGGTPDGTALLGDGAAFDPAVGTWETVASSAAPAARYDHTAVWTKGSNPESMMVWGGIGFDPVGMGNVFLNDGAILDPKGLIWAPVNSNGAPSPRSQATAVWTGASTLIWGGVDAMGYVGSGAKYVTGNWYPISNDAPAPRAGHSAAMIKATAGDRMIVWGGVNGSGYLNTGALLEESMLTWSPPLPTAPTARAHHSTVISGGSSTAIGSKMIIWGGDVNGGSGLTDSGAIFNASAM